MIVKNPWQAAVLLLILVVLLSVSVSPPENSRTLASTRTRPAAADEIRRPALHKLLPEEPNANLVLLLDRVVQCIAERSDYEAAIAAIRESTPEEQRPEQELAIARALALVNPNWAVTLIFFLPSESARNQAAMLAADIMVKNGIAEALEWAESLPVGFTRSVAVDRIVYDIGREDPMAALQTIDALPTSLVRDDALCSLAALWANRDRAQAVRWASSIGDGALRLRVFASIGFALAQSGPSAVARMARGIDSAADRAVFLSSVEYTLARANANEVAHH